MEEFFNKFLKKIFWTFYMVWTNIQTFLEESLEHFVEELLKQFWENFWGNLFRNSLRILWRISEGINLCFEEFLSEIFDAILVEIPEGNIGIISEIKIEGFAEEAFWAIPEEGIIGGLLTQPLEDCL